MISVGNQFTKNLHEMMSIDDLVDDANKVIELLMNKRV